MTDLADIFADEFGVPRRTPEQREELDRKLAEVAGLSLDEFRQRRWLVDERESGVARELTPRERICRDAQAEIERNPAQALAILDRAVEELHRIEGNR